MKIKLIFVTLALLATAIAADATLKLTINGSPALTPALVVNGKTYLPLEALQAAGVKVVRSGAGLSVTLPTAAVAAGGANARPSLEGCLGESLFNGVWRIKALKLERISKDTDTAGWGLTVEVRNGSKTTISPTNAGFDGTGQGIQLAFSDATTLSVDAYDVQKLTFAMLPAGGAVMRQLKFYYPMGTPVSAIQTPVKFLLEIDPKGIGDSTRAKGVAFSVPNPSLRVSLDCQK